MDFITLLTDFGNLDEYAGVMKGVIYSVNPEVRIVDLTHGTAPQDVTQAAYTIKASYHYFPKRTIHIVVVDPGVGTRRKIVALKLDGHFFVAPDNGVLSLLWQDHEVESAVRVENPEYFLKEVSRTFHGRDIFAPVAGWISRKVPLEHFGPETEVSSLQSIETIPAKAAPPDGVPGKIISVDRFGNLLTNIEEKTIYHLCRKYPDRLPVIKSGNLKISGLSSSYQDVPSGHGLMIIGSRGFLEISVNGGDASRQFNIHRNDSVELILESTVS